VPRPEGRAGGLARLLAIEGAVPLQLPLLRIESIDARARVAAAVDRLRAGAYGWVAFTSVTAVDQWFARLQAMGLDSRAFAYTSSCAVGPATRDALERRGIVADLVPQKATGRAAAAALVEAGVFGARILLPRAARADRSLSRALVTAGATVDHLPLYRTIVIEDATSALDDFAPEGIDLVTLASPSAARSWAALVAGKGPQLRAFPFRASGRPPVPLLSPSGLRWWPLLPTTPLVAWSPRSAPISQLGPPGESID
jgi:uroporphyrinogen III methyltransferase/synthase